MRILAIGGSVIKTAHDELREICSKHYIDVLIHCGGSIFHDFQRTTEKLDGHSYSLDSLIDNCEPNRAASELVWTYIEKPWRVPENSVTHICRENEIGVLLFTILGADFWQLFDNRWELVAKRSKLDFDYLCDVMRKEFHFINMGSAVIMPEVFTKALAVVHPKKFRADVVDFLPEMYRPMTRVAKYGDYFHMEAKEFLKQWLFFGSMDKLLGYKVLTT